MQNMKALEFKPSAFWRLDGTSPFTDYSGYGRTATQAGTQAKSVALTTDAAYSQQVGSTNAITFTSNVYQNAGNNSLPFTLAVTLYPSTAATITNLQVMSKTGQTDGIYLSGTTVYFKMQYATTGSVTCSYDLGVMRKANVVAVHTETKNSLYVNGELVDEVNISETQQADVYITATNNNLVAGAGAGKVLLNNAIIYARALKQQEITALYEWDNRTATGDVAKSFGGETINLSVDTRIPVLDTGFYTDDDWNTGALTNVTADDDQLVASLTGGYTAGGTWYNSVNLQQGLNTVTYTALYLDWDGSNVTVAYSTDGTNWTNATKNTAFTASAAMLFLRVTFTAGQSFAYIENLRVFGYTSNSATIAGRSITFPAGATMLNDHDVFEFSDDWGVKLNGGTLTLTADPQFQPVVYEVWIKQGTGASLTRSATSNATWTNGLTSGSTPPVGEWSIMHFRSAAAITTDITLTGDVQIGRIVLYPTDVSASIPNIYTSYTGVPKSTTADTNTITLAEPATPAVVYAHDWQVLAAS